MSVRVVRQSAGVVVLLAAVATIGILSVPYWENRAYGDDLSALVARNAGAAWPEERWRQAALELAARRGLPVRASEVKVERMPAGTRVEVRYQKNVDLFVYSVRLHMRAKSGS